MNEALLLLGGDLGDVKATQDRAIALLGERAGTVLARSREHWTEPWGFTSDTLFLNTAVVLRTDLEPGPLLEQCLGIERDLGRARSTAERHASRTLDIDLLLYADRTVNETGLVLPHPRMHERLFALAPAADVAPHGRHPSIGRTVLDLLNDLRSR